MKRLFISLLLALFLFGCEQNPYQVIKGKDGEIYRLNKKTGEMAIIKDDKILPLEALNREDAEFLLNLRLGGILWDTKSPNASLAYINDKVYKIDDMISQYRIKEIKKLSVIFEKEGKTLEIKLSTENNK